MYEATRDSRKQQPKRSSSRESTAHLAEASHELGVGLSSLQSRVVLMPERRAHGKTRREIEHSQNINSERDAAVKY